MAILQHLKYICVFELLVKLSSIYELEARTVCAEPVADRPC